MLVAGVCTAHPQAAQFVQLDRSVIESRLKDIGHANADWQKVLKRSFEDAGCGQRLREQPVKRSKIPNVICTMAGETAKTIIVGAHFDRVDGSHGIADNWSGAALLPTLFQCLQATRRRHTFVFVGFTDEERGLVGSEFHAKSMTVAERVATRAMINP